MSSEKYLKAGDCVTDSADTTCQHSTFILVPSYLKESLLSTARNDQTISIVGSFLYIEVVKRMYVVCLCVSRDRLAIDAICQTLTVSRM